MYLAWMPVEYPRIGTIAGLGVGVVFGSTMPVDSDSGARLTRAIKTSMAFALTTGLGYGFYQGLDSGIAWGVGGTVGCLCGALAAQVVRLFFGGTEEE